MNNIKLIKLEFSNFKGVKLFGMILEGKNANLYGENGTGKTTIKDAWLWLFTNKNSEGNTKFNIKPLNTDGTEVHGVDSNVTVVITKDDIPTTFSKTYQEVWRTPTGKTEKIFDSHKVVYTVNEGNVPQKVFQDRVNDLIGDEKIFRLLSDVYAFTSQKDKEQREILFNVLGGDIPVETILESNAELKPLANLLETTKLEFLESETKGQIKKNKDEKTLIPSRLDELNNMLVEVNVEEKQKEIDIVNEELAIIDEEIVQANIHNEEITDKKNELYAKDSKYNNEYAKAKNLAEKAYIDDKYKLMDDKQRELDKEYEKLKSEIDSKYDYSKSLKKLDWTNNEITILNSVLWGSKDTQMKLTYQINGIETNISNLRSFVKKATEQTFTFDESKTICPTCNRTLENMEQYKKDEEEKFNSDKSYHLNDLKEKGNSYIADKKVLEKALAKVDEDIKCTHDNIVKLESDITIIKSQMVEKPPVESELLTKLENEISTLQNEIRNIPELAINFENMTLIKCNIEGIKDGLSKSEMIDTSTCKITKGILENKLKTLTKEIESLDNNSKVEVRINELMDRERELANKIAVLEGTINLLNIFTTTKANLISSKINDRFKTISFKLFETFIGSDGIKEVCEATINGVPYSNANSAAKINAGLEIISILSEYYQASCPIFIDKCESITHPQSTDSQLITLNVQKFTNKDKTINNEMVEAFKLLHPTAIKINNMFIEVVE